MNSSFDDHRNATPHSQAELLELAARLSDREIYSTDRDKLLTELTSRRFQFKTIVHQITKSYVSDLASHRNGMTVEGVLITTDVAVQIQFPAELNEPISTLQSGESVQVDGVLNRWMTGLDRLEFWSSGCYSMTPDPRTVDASAASPVTSTTLLDNTPVEATADARGGPPPTPLDTLAELPSRLDSPNPATPLAASAATPDEVEASTAMETARATESLSAEELSGPHGTATSSNPARTEFAQRRSTITSQQITEHVATSCNVTEAQAAAAIEAMWSIITDSRHYEDGHSAVEIPCFGRFLLVTGHHQTNLEFESHTSRVFQEQAITRTRQRWRAGKRHLATDQQVARQEQLQRLASQIHHQHSRLPAAAASAGKPAHDAAFPELPFEQQLAHDTGESAQVHLETASHMACELIETVCAIMAHGKVSIRWARRGEMIPSRDGDDVTYRFRTYSTFGKKVPEPTGSGSKRRRKNMN
ncbi:MAG: hypothetical protein VX346_29330, partial [Planctomycetota bacterium]|nr:hypothetical protein [Planctomycetota bacterium]